MLSAKSDLTSQCYLVFEVLRVTFVMVVGGRWIGFRKLDWIGQFLSQTTIPLLLSNSLLTFQNPPLLFGVPNLEQPLDSLSLSLGMRFT
jgi:hypothetical protein